MLLQYTKIRIIYYLILLFKGLSVREMSKSPGNRLFFMKKAAIRAVFGQRS